MNTYIFEEIFSFVLCFLVLNGRPEPFRFDNVNAGRALWSDGSVMLVHHLNARDRTVSAQFGYLCDLSVTIAS